MANRLTSPTPLWRVEDWAQAGQSKRRSASPQGAQRRPHRPRAGRDRAQPRPDRGVGRRPRDRHLRAGGRAAALGHDLDLVVWRLPGARAGICGAPVRPPKDRRPTSSSCRPAWRSTATAASRCGIGPTTAAPVRSPRSPGRCARCASWLASGACCWWATPSWSATPTAGHHGRQGGLHRPGIQDLRGCRGAGCPGPCRSRPVDYLAERDQGKPPHQRGSYRVVEDTMTLAGKRQRDPVLHLRRVFVCPVPAPTRRHRPGQEARPGPRRPSAAHPGPGRPPLPRRPRGHRPAGRHQPQPPGRWPAARHGGTDQATGSRPWRGGSTRRAGRRGRHRRLVCAADQPDPAQANAADVLARDKGQEVVERRYGTFKGPLAVAALFVQPNRRSQPWSP